MNREKPTIGWVVERFDLRPNRAGFILCPVHEERTPSCQLKDDWWYCYGCGANGDSIGLIAAITRQPVADVLRHYAEKVPSWRHHRTLAQPPRGSTVRRAYRALHNWFFHELASRLEGAPDWLMLRVVDWWGEQFDVVDEVIRVEDDLPKAEALLRGLSALCERGLESEASMFWEWCEGQATLRREGR